MSETCMPYYAHESPFWQKLLFVSCFVLFCFVYFFLFWLLAPHAQTRDDVSLFSPQNTKKARITSGVKTE